MRIATFSRGCRATAPLLALCALLGAGPVRAACTLKHMEIPVRMIDQRPVAMLKLNGTEVPMLVNTGAFISVLSASTAAQLKLTLTRLPPDVTIHDYAGRIDARRTRVERVGLLSAELRDIDFVVGGNELGAGVMGILGRNILGAADAEYDLARGAVRLVFPQGDCRDANLAYWAGDAPVVQVPLEDEDRPSSTAIRTEVKVNGKRTIAVLSTGAPATALTLDAARRAGIAAAEMTPRNRSVGAGAGLQKSWTAKVGQFELGGEKIRNIRLQVDDTDHFDDGLVLGLDYFLSHRIYVSRLQRQIYITWNGSSVFPTAQTQQPDLDPRYAALPKDPDPDDADALARRGAAAMAAGQHQRALQDLNRANELAPGVADYAYARARLHLDMQQPRLALDDLDRALQLDAALADARLRRARLRVALGDRAGAQADVQQLDAALPPSAGQRADMGSLLLGLDQTTEGLRQLDLWIDTHPKDARLARVLNTRCWTRTRLNVELQLALRDCKRAVDLDEGSAVLHDSLGWTYLRLDDLTRARKAFDEAIKIEARPFSLYGRGLVHQRLNDAASSERDLAAARLKLPRIGDEVRRQGFVFDEAGRPLPATGP